MHVVQNTPRLDDLWLSLGRTWESDLTVNDYTVSRVHARMRPAPSRFGFWLEDLGSTNGTWVNEVELEPHQRVLVQTQDNLRFGRQNLILLAPWDFCLMLQEMG
jgi:pSer/pThr/pTyr-binding forkhead associated (FHA) protein